MNLVMLVVGASIKGSVLLLLAWLVTHTFRNILSAASRHLMWAAALGGMLVMPVLTLVAPRIESRFVPALPTHASISTSTTVEELPPGVLAAPASPTADPSFAPALAPTVSEPPAPATSHSIDFFALLPLIWGVGALLLIARLAISTFRVSLWSRRAAPVEDGGWLSLVQRLAARLRITRPVVLLRSERACVPMTWGVVYPTVLLPIDADDWTDERRTIVLLHELAHVKRLDAFTQLVAQLATGLFWFNPLVWLAARQMRTEREHACDDFVLEGGARASDYANDLLSIARSLGGSSAPAAAALAMARRSEFEGRLLAILDPTTDRRSVSRKRLALASASVIVLALPLAALTPATVVQTTPAIALEGVPTALPVMPPPAATELPVAAETEVQLPAPLPLKAGDVRASTAAPPDRETLIAVAKRAAKMTSDYDKAELLITIAKYYVPDDELRGIYLDAVASMQSDYERSRTLAPLLEKDSALPPKALAQVVAIASKMTSDYEKANLIVNTIGDGRVLSPETRAAAITAMGSINGSYDRRRAITAFVKHTQFNADDAIGLINVARTMSSDYDKAESLIEIGSHFGLNDAGVRNAYMKAAETISSASDYRRVMAGALK